VLVHVSLNVSGPARILDRPPGLRPHHHEQYYGALVLDPNGNNVEAVCHAPD